MKPFPSRGAHYCLRAHGGGGGRSCGRLSGGPRPSDTRVLSSLNPSLTRGPRRVGTSVVVATYSRDPRLGIHDFSPQRAYKLGRGLLSLGHLVNASSPTPNSHATKPLLRRAKRRKVECDCRWNNTCVHCRVTGRGFRASGTLHEDTRGDGRHAGTPR